MNKKISNIMSDLSLVIVAIIWGSGFIASQMAIDANMSLCFIMFLRFAIATVILFLVLNKKLRRFDRYEIKAGIIAGVLLFLAFLAQTVGLVYTTPSNNAFLTAINVIMVPFISWKLTKIKPTKKVFVAAIICMTGISILTYSFDKGLVFNVGDLLTILCAFLFACHIAYVDIGAKKMSTSKFTFLQMGTAALLSLIVFLIFDIKSFMNADFSKGLMPVIYLGVFSTCVAFFIQTKAQEKTSATKAAIILSNESLFGSIFSVILGYESLTINLVLGGVVVLFSILMLEIKLKGMKKVDETTIERLGESSNN